jgi:hypothetical protein
MKQDYLDAISSVAMWVMRGLIWGAKRKYGVTVDEIIYFIDAYDHTPYTKEDVLAILKEFRRRKIVTNNKDKWKLRLG